MSPAASDRPVVYVETSVFSYLTGRKSRHAATALRQAVTREWWETGRARFHLVVSEIVYREAERGDEAAAEKRLKLLAEADLLVLPADLVKDLTRQLVAGGAFPAKAAADAGHVATAAVAGVDHLCSWNFRHLLNPAIRRRSDEICRERGFRPATICTPEELMFA